MGPPPKKDGPIDFGDPEPQIDFGDAADDPIDFGDTPEPQIDFGDASGPPADIGDAGRVESDSAGGSFWDQAGLAIGTVSPLAGAIVGGVSKVPAAAGTLGKFLGAVYDSSQSSLEESQRMAPIDAADRFVREHYHSAREARIRRFNESGGLPSPREDALARLEEDGYKARLDSLRKSAALGFDVLPKVTEIWGDIFRKKKRAHPLYKNLTDDEILTLWSDPKFKPYFEPFLKNYAEFLVSSQPQKVENTNVGPTHPMVGRPYDKEIDWEESGFASLKEKELGPGFVGGTLAQEHINQYYKALHDSFLNKYEEDMAAGRGLSRLKMEVGPYGRMAGISNYGLYPMVERASIEYMGLISSPARYVAAAMGNIPHLDAIKKFVDPDPNGTGYLGFANQAAGAMGHLSSGLAASFGDRMQVSDYARSPGKSQAGDGSRSFSEVFVENFLDEDHGFKWDRYTSNEWHAVGSFFALPFHIVDGLGQAAHFWNSNAPYEAKVEASKDVWNLVTDEMARRYGRLLSFKSDVWEESALFAGLDLAVVLGFSGKVLREAQSVAMDKAIDVADGYRLISKPIDKLDPLRFLSEGLSDDIAKAMKEGNGPLAAQLAVKQGEILSALNTVEKKVPAYLLRNEWRGDLLSDMGSRALHGASEALGGMARVAEVTSFLSTKANPLFGPAYLLGRSSDGVMRGVTMLSRLGSLRQTPQRARQWAEMLMSKDARGIAMERYAALDREATGNWSRRVFALQDILRQMDPKDWKTFREMAKFEHDHIVSHFDRDLNIGDRWDMFRLKENVLTDEGLAAYREKIESLPDGALDDLFDGHLVQSWLEFDASPKASEIVSRVKYTPPEFSPFPPDSPSGMWEPSGTHRVVGGGLRSSKDASRIDKIEAIIGAKESTSLRTGLSSEYLNNHLRVANKYVRQVVPIMDDLKTMARELGLVDESMQRGMFWAELYSKPSPGGIRQTINKWFHGKSLEEQVGAQLQTINALDEMIRARSSRTNLHRNAGKDFDVSIPVHIRESPHGGQYVDMYGNTQTHLGYKEVFDPGGSTPNSGKTFGQLLTDAQTAKARIEGTDFKSPFNPDRRYATLEKSLINEVLGALSEHAYDIERLWMFRKASKDAAIWHKAEDAAAAMGGSESSLSRPVGPVSTRMQKEGWVYVFDPDDAASLKASTPEILEGRLGLPRGSVLSGEGRGGFGEGHWVIKTSKIFGRDNYDLVAIENRRIHKDTAAREFGELKNGFLHPDIAIQDAASTRYVKAYENGFGPWLTRWKALKTAWSVPTHAVNWMSNAFILAPMAGVSPFDPRNWKYYMKAAEDFASSTGSSELRRWIEAGGRGPRSVFTRAETMSTAQRGIGLMYQGIFAQPKRAYRELAEMSLRGSRGLWPNAWEGSKAVGRILRETPGSMYQMGDDFYRYVKFLEATSGGMDDSAAALLGRKAFADYENLSGAFQLVRSKWWGEPFVSFDARMIPRFNQWVDSNPLAANSILRLHNHMTRINFANSGLDYDEWRDYQSVGLPFYDNIKMHLLEISPVLNNLAKHLAPEHKEYLTSIATKVLPGARRLPKPSQGGWEDGGEPWLRTAKVLATSSPIKVGEANPLVSAALAMGNISLYRKGRLVSEDSPLKWRDIGMHIAGIAMPSWSPLGVGGLNEIFNVKLDFTLGAYHNEQIRRARQGGVTPGREVPRSELEALLGISGLDARGYASRDLWELAMRLPNAMPNRWKKELSRITRNRSRMSPEDFDTARRILLDQLNSSDGIMRGLKSQAYLIRTWNNTWKRTGAHPPFGYDPRVGKGAHGFTPSEFISEEVGHFEQPGSRRKSKQTIGYLAAVERAGGGLPEDIERKLNAISELGGKQQLLKTGMKQGDIKGLDAAWKIIFGDKEIR